MPVILHVLLCAAVSGDAAVETKRADQWQSAKECLAALEASYGAPAHKMQILQEQALQKFCSKKQRVTLTVPIRLEPLGKKRYQVSLRSETRPFPGLVPGLPDTLYGEPTGIWAVLDLSDQEALALPDKPNATIVLEPGAGKAKGGVAVYFKHGGKPDKYNPQTRTTPHYRSIYYGIVSLTLLK
jgi:hypothetical protein